jgi:hypothetical protein
MKRNTSGFNINFHVFITAVSLVIPCFVYCNLHNQVKTLGDHILNDKQLWCRLGRAFRHHRRN